MSDFSLIAKAKDKYVGMRHGRLLVASITGLKLSGRGKYRVMHCLCRCDCGETVEMPIKNFLYRTSCGCGITAAPPFSHGYCDSVLDALARFGASGDRLKQNLATADSPLAALASAGGISYQREAYGMTHEQR